MTQKLAKEEAKDTLARDGSFISFTYDNKPVQTTDSVVLLGTRKRYIMLRDLRDSTNHFYERDKIKLIKTKKAKL